MLGHPAGRGVGLVDRRRVVRFRRRGVVHIDRHRTRADHQVADQPLVGREVAKHPTAAVEEHEYWQVTLHIGRAYHLQLDRLAAGLDGAFLYFDTGEVDLDRSLGPRQHCPGVFRAELFQRLAAALFQGFEKRLGVLFDTRATRSESAGNGQGQKGGGKGFVDNVHERILFHASVGSGRLAWPVGPSLRLVRRLGRCTGGKKPL
ncbi:hypothetical protein D3C80_1405840 [compost metagenome]